MNSIFNRILPRVMASCVAGGLAGMAGGVLVEPASGFAVWSGLLWAGIGVLAAGVGAISGELVQLLSRRTLANPVRISIAAVAILGSGIVGGAVASALLEVTSSVYKVGGTLGFGLVAAASMALSAYLRSRPREHARADI